LNSRSRTLAPEVLEAVGSISDPSTRVLIIDFSLVGGTHCLPELACLLLPILFVLE
jgi:hypothetical protein